MEGLLVGRQPIDILENEGELVVSSRQVAEDFGKEHRNVTQTIRNLTAENSAVKNMVIETTYEHKGNCYPEYLLTST